MCAWALEIRHIYFDGTYFQVSVDRMAQSVVFLKAPFSSKKVCINASVYVLKVQFGKIVITGKCCSR